MIGLSQAADQTAERIMRDLCHLGLNARRRIEAGSPLCVNNVELDGLNDDRPFSRNNPSSAIAFPAGIAWHRSRDTVSRVVTY